MRIRGAKTEMEEAGLETEGMVESTAKLRQEILALSGVDIMLDNDTFKSTYQIMDELSTKWKDLTDIQQATITELIAGKRQGNIVSSLMTNFDTAREALNTSMNSDGSAMEEHAKWSESIEAHILRLKAAWQSFAQTFMDSDTLKAGIKVLTGLLDVLEKIIDNFGLIGTIGAGVAIKSIFSYFKGAKEAKKTLNDVVDAINELPKAMANTSSAATETAKAMANVSSSATEVTESVTNVSSTLTEVGESSANAASTVTETTESMSNVGAASSEAAESAANLSSTVTETTESVANMGSTVTETTETMTNFISGSSEFTESMGNMSSTTTEFTESMANVSSTITETTESVTNFVGGGSEFVESAGNMTSALTEGAEAAVNLGGAVVESGAAAGKAAGGFKAFATSTAGIVTGIGLAVAAIALIINAYKNYREEQSKIRQENIDTADTFLDSAFAFEQAYVKYSGKTNLTLEEESELESAINGTVDALDDKSSALQGVVSSSSDYLASLESIKNAELDAANRAAQRKKDDAQAELKDVVKGWSSIDGSEVSVNISNAEVLKAAQEIGGEYFNVASRTAMSGNGASRVLTIDPNAGISDILEYYHTLEDVRDRLEADGLKDTTEYERIKAVIDEMSGAIETYESGVYDAAKAQYQLSNGIPKTADEYLDMRETILGGMDDLSVETRKNIAGMLDSEYSQIFDLSSAKVQARKLIGILDEFGEAEAGQVETFLNMRTAVNNNECTVGEYMSQFDEIERMTDGWSEESKEEFNVAFGIDADNIKAQYEDLYKYLSNQDLPWFDDYEFTPEFRLEKENIKDSEVRKFLDDLTASELTAVASIRTEIDWENTDIEDIRKIIQKQVDINEAMAFQTDIEVDTTALELLNTALAESASAMGLTEDSIDSLKAKYKDLEGYSPDTLFEATANGVKVNREEVAKLEKEYNDLKKAEVQEHLDTLVDKYNEVTEEIDKCTNASERARLLSEREGYKSQIEELAEYQAQLEGVTGAYQRWIDAQNAPEDYEGYQAVATSREDIKDEISRGFISNSTKEYIDLLSGEDLVGGTIDDYADAWDRLGKKVGSTSYSIHDFFTINDDGDITATGIDRFFEGLKKDFKGSVAKFNEESGKWEYDFSQENLKKIQDEWGIGIEAIQLLLEAAIPAGYDVDWDGILDSIDLDTSNFETLVSMAESAQKAFNKLEDVEDVDFNFTATGVEEATSEVEKARSAYLDLITNKDGTINLKAEGAEEMRFMLSTLLIQKQQLEDSNIAINIDTSGLDESQQDIAEAIDAVSTFREKYKNLEIAVSTGQGIEEAKTELATAMGELQGLGDAGVDIAAQLILGEGADGETLKGKVDAAITAVGDANIKVGCKLEDTAIGDLNSQILTNFTPEATVKITGIDDTLVGQYTSTEKTANGTVKWKNDDKLVVDFQKKVHQATGKVNWENNETNVKKSFTATGTVTWTSGNNVQVKVISSANGTANANGTAFANGTSGKAFKHGDWGIKGSGTALVGELGMETLVRGGHFYTIGNTGAEFIKYRNGDIIFNHKQTEELFKYGKVVSDGGRGKMFANGSAFANGSYPSSGAAFWEASASESGFASSRKNGTSNTFNYNNVNVYNNDITSSSSSRSTSSSSSSAAEEFKEVIDWIEIAINRIEREIDRLDQKAANVYKSWSSRNSALVSEISKVGDEIKLQQSAYDRYIQEANRVGLSSSWAEKVRNGTIDISTIRDENLAEKIGQYQDWYEKALDCQDAIEELKETEASLYAQRVENIATQYDGILSVVEHEKNMLDEYISQTEANAMLVSGEYYKALASNEQEKIQKLEKEKSAMLTELQAVMESETITEGSEAWYDMIASIDEVTLSIAESETQLKEYEQTLQQLSWEQFDLLQDKISAITEETDFLIELMSSDKLYDDKGQLTDSGMATMGQYGVAYNTHMYQADLSAKEAERLKKELEKDPFDTELEERYREMVSLQQEHILAAQDEKEAIRDMVSEGIELELDALQELIDKKNEALESERDLYEYQKKVKEQTKEIASLEKQIAAYSGDTSEEAKAKVQELKVSLQEAKTDLEETEYDKFIGDTSALLDELYLSYEEVLNARLDNLDALVSDMITQINTDATSISTTLSEKADSVGYMLSSSMTSIWDTNSTKINNVITTYGDKFSTAQTTTNNTLGTINTNLQNMIAQLNALAKTNVKSASTSSAANSTEAKVPKKEEPKKEESPKTDSKVNNNTLKGIAAAIWIYGSKSGWGNNPFRENKLSNKIGAANAKKVQDYINKYGSNGGLYSFWIQKGKNLNKYKYSAFKSGAKNIDETQFAWTQEGGKQEYIVRPSDGAILTPIAKRDSVLNATASNNIWDMANSPAEFIKDNLKLDAANVPNGTSVQSNLTQHFENITFSLPNVKDYDSLLKQMKKDPNFEKFILSFTIDQVAGKSSLAKGKSIR